MQIFVNSIKISRNIDTFVNISLCDELTKDSILKPTNKRRKDYLLPCSTANQIALITDEKRCEYYIHIVVVHNRVQEISVISE